MSSHLHLLCKGTDGFILSGIMRDFKKFASKKIMQTIQDERESRREWMLDYFQKSCEHLKKEQKHKVGKVDITLKLFKVIGLSNKK